MRASPVYGDQPVMRMQGVVADPATPLLRQRARLVELVAGLDDAQWAAASRCAGWSVQDVVAHLTGTNQFWAFSINAGAAGTPTRLLTEFDPVATPAQMVAGLRRRTPAEALEHFRASNDALAASIGALAGEGWERPAEAPPGHIAIRLVALHALWDAWVHERDIAIPLGLDVVEEPDEIVASLAYIAALGPAFSCIGGSDRQGVLEVRVTDPEGRFLVEIGSTVTLRDGATPGGAVALDGDAVGLLEALSFRAPLTAEIGDADRWLLGGLDQIFEQA